MGIIEEKQNLQEKEARPADEMIQLKDEDEAASSSVESSSSSVEIDGQDDVSSSSSASASASTFGPLYELSEQLMSQLPINNSSRRRGLSKFYSGKSQSFASLANVEGDLAKKGRCYNRRMKWCKSYCYGGNLHLNHLSPKSRMIAKRAAGATPRRSASFSPSTLDHAIDGFPALLLFHA